MTANIRETFFKHYLECKQNHQTLKAEALREKK